MRDLSRTLLLAALVMAFLGSPSEAQAQDFIIVVHAENQTESLSRPLLSKIFLKKSARWGDGKERIVPVDQLEKAPVRESFSLAIHDKSVAAIKAYWQRMIFSGRETPPLEQTSDQDVLKFVAANRGAIGYVSKGTTLSAGVKELKVTDRE